MGEGEWLEAVNSLTSSLNYNVAHENCSRVKMDLINKELTDRKSVV